MKSFVAVFVILAGLVSFAVAEIEARANNVVDGYAGFGGCVLFTGSTSIPTHGSSCPQNHWRRRWTYHSSHHPGCPQVCRQWEFPKNCCPRRYVYVLFAFFLICKFLGSFPERK